jgi:hypothetical protein
MGADADLAARMGPELGLLLPLLDERSRRLVLGAVARAAGEGGAGAVARVSGASWQTVADGAAELASGQVAEPGRVRRRGGGRKRLAESDPGLVPALEELVADSTRGDPGSPLTWTTKSLANLAGELAARGHRCSVQTVARLLHEQGYSLQADAKTIEGRQHPDRDAQFRYIAAQASEHMAAGQPVISVDAKKKEQVGQYARDGREWRPAGDPVLVRDHDFPDAALGKVTPYGICDVAANTGFVNVGTDHDTAAFAVESVRCWWDTLGKDAYPGARRLLVTADAGGSNGYRTRAWKTGLADLARQTGLEITVCHFPPGTSKWNKIEHRLFAQITRNWRARPLTSHEVIIKTIAAVTTRTGLAVTAVLDERAYPTGIRSTGAQVRELEDTGALTRHSFRGDWNYAIGPAARAPAPPPPAPADPALGQILDALASPVLTGMPRQDFDALVTALEIPFAAAREQRLHLARGRARRHNGGRSAPVRLTLPACLLATICRHRLGMPCYRIAALLGVDASTISLATNRITALLGRDSTVLAPGPARLATPGDLRRHAAAAGITIPASPAAAPSTEQAPDTPQTHLILE